MRRGEGERGPAASWPQLQEEEGQQAEAEAQGPQLRWIMESESRSRLQGTEAPPAILPRNRRYSSTLAWPASYADAPAVAHTKKISITVPFPQGSGDRVREGRSSQLAPELVLPASVDGVPLTVKQEPPVYSVRAVVRQEDHPLWSSSPQAWLEYLFGSTKSRQDSLEREDRITSPKGSEPPVRKVRSSLPLTEESGEGGWDTPHSTPEERQCTGLPMQLSPPPQQQPQKALAAVGDRTSSPAGEQRFGVTLPRAPQPGLQRLRLREAATLVSALLRDECVCRQALVAEERHEAISDIAMPPDATFGSLHPALLAGIEEVVIMEEICRSYIVEEEASQIAPIWDFYVSEHRCLVTSLAPLKRFLRRWVLCHRGRKERHLARQKCLRVREEKSRLEITHAWLGAQQRLFASLVGATEALFRALIEEMQLCTQYAHGFASIRLKEQVELFPLLYGAAMPRAVVCGRISGYTLFKQLDLHDQHERHCLSKWEERDRIVIASMMQREALEGFLEAPRRQNIVEEESAARVKLTFTLFAMAGRCHRREIEIEEACEWQIDLLPHLHAASASDGRRAEERQATVLSLTKMQGCPT
ncbi:uncharacterized protein Tco025E_02905 [Trypanosoma conorhini]|uniref:Uncharacterized protein n=1 Tax=Trypanosoma conorhini TaxID=83891 RepID=A0A422Q048_9TRYP|nr:uncharacterized protein Tco025E_02905 [Trypanosoma conorhini]RNF23389.1 hypothetical protein Tco025E_02905 [Trypanosoma conorhini]